MKYGKKIHKLGGLVKAAIFLSITFTSVAEAQSILDAVAIDGEDNTVHVSWRNTNTDLDFYVIHWGNEDHDKRRICHQGQWDRPNCDSFIDFDSAGSRLEYTVVHANAQRFDDIQSLRIRAGQGRTYYPFSGDITVNNGLPSNLRAVRSGNNLNVTWDENPRAAAAGIDRYVVRTRPQAWVNNNGRRSTTNQTRITIPNYLENFRPPYAVNIQAIYDSGETVKSGWINETSQDAAPITPPTTTPGGDQANLPTGDLTDQCRPNRIPGTTNVHDRIGAVGEYAEARIPLESHVWFFPTEADQGGLATGENFGHAHLLTCVPHTTLGNSAQVRNRNLPLDLEIIAHLTSAKKLDGSILNPAEDNVEVRIGEIEIRGRNGSGSDILVDRIDIPTKICKAGESHHCTYQQRVNVSLHDSPNTSDDKPGFEYNGVKELRIAAIHDVFINERPVAIVRAILRHPVELNISGRRAASQSNVSGIRNFSTSITESSGWLIEDDRDGFGGYATVGIRAFNGQDGMLPVEPISKSRTPTVELKLHFEADPCVNNCRVDNMPITQYWGFIDPNVHGEQALCADGRTETDDELGRVVRSCRVFSEPIQGDRTSYSASFDISDLSVGMHTLMLAVEQPMVNGQPGSSKRTSFRNSHIIDDERFESTLTGLLLVRFIVTE